MKKFVYILSAILVVIGCSKSDQSKVAGIYLIDKFSVRDSSIHVAEYRILELKRDQTFELRHVDKSGSVNGKWLILRGKDDGATIQFEFPTKTIEAELKGTIFYFDYPNDLYNGKYDRMLYVQSTQSN